LSQQLQNKISEWLPNKRFVLLYKASVDGFLSANFHQKCDDKGPTVTIIQSKEGGNLFGGYTSQSWDSSNAYKQDPSAFIFTLTNPHAIPPTQYAIKNIPRSIRGRASYGPLFGGGYDVRIVSGSNQNNSSYTNFPTSYTDTTGKGDVTFTGARNFSTSEVEVYSVL